MAFDHPEPPVPIAVVGMGCRLPGGADSPHKLWELISKGGCTWTDVPPDRWNWKSFYHPHPDSQEAHNQRGGHFIKQDIATWDTNFFSVAPGEAKTIDPQQRILLETTFEALENAGIPLEAIRGSDTAVYVATFSQDYETMLFKDTHNLAKYHVTGTHKAIVANRISYVFDLRGPSLSLDTACSGGLVALHQACQTLRTRESRLALVGGTNLILSPEFMFGMSFLNMLNDDGRSYSFDTRGAGYGRGEGVATIVLKRLDDAIADGDPIRAVIRNTGVNQDGKTNGITYPSEESQEILARAVYFQAGLDPAETAYVEAHGTGTIAGDKIEMGAIRKVFCPEERDTPLYVGSIKANLGHLECTSGLAAVIKTVLALEKGFIPAVPSLVTLKDSLRDIVRSRIKIPRKLEVWPLNSIRRASVQNFGFGGTNAHVILEAINAKDVTEEHAHKNAITHFSAGAGKPQLFVLTAKAKDSLLSSLKQLRDWANAHLEESRLQDLAYTLAARRSVMTWRASFVASTKEDLLSSLENLPISKAVRSPPVIFLFTGQGAQWHAMGRELLLDGCPSVFRDSILKSDRIMKDMGLTWSLMDELMKNENYSKIDRSEVAQPASTAIQVALVDLLMTKLGIIPKAVVGHSSGEISAAYAAGALTQKEALAISLCRSNISQWCREMIPRRGAMMAVGLGEADVLPYLQQLNEMNGIASVACVNSPISTTISGDKDAIDDLQAILEKASIFNRPLKVDTAYHSHHTKAVAERYLEALGAITGATLPSTVTRFFSSVTAKEKTSGFGSKYWVENLISQVRFSEALEALCQSLRQEASGLATPIFIEIGPHAALKGPFSQTLKELNLPDFEYHYTSALVREQNARQSILASVGKVFELGYMVDIEAANSALGLPKQTAQVLTDLPTYPWDHSVKHWHESRLSKSYRFRQHPYHDILGLRVISCSIDPIWRQILSVDRQPWLQDHVVDNFMVFPGSGYVCMAVEASWQLARDSGTSEKIQHVRLRNVQFIKALVIPDSPDTIEIQIILRQGSGNWYNFSVVSLSSSDQWTEHCRGSVAALYGDEENDVEGFREREFAAIAQAEWLQKAQETCVAVLDHDTIYSNLSRNGNRYGAAFADIVEERLGDYQAVATVRIPEVRSRMPGQYMQPHIIHPTTLDAITHVFLPMHAQYHKSGSVMPTRIGEILISSQIANEPGKELEVTVAMDSRGGKIVVLGKGQTDLRSRPLVSMSELKTVIIGEAQHSIDKHDARSAVLNVDWEVNADFFEGNSREETTPSSGEDVDRQHLLDRAAALFIKRCVRDISREDSRPVPIGISGYRKRLYEWMLQYSLSNANKILLEDAKIPEPAEIAALVHELGVEGELLSKVGPSLEPIIAGAFDPLPLFLEEDKFSRVQEGIETTRQLRQHVGEYLRLYALNRPSINVLEIGACTGNSTRAILDAMHGRNLRSYSVTERIPQLLDKLKVTLTMQTEFLSFKILDINRDLLSQEFVPESYDVVIVNNILHMANSLNTALANIRKLLTSGGALVLMGLTDLSPSYGLIFGALETTWSDQRSHQLPFPSPAEWNHTLLANSLSSLEPATHISDRVGQKSYCIVSTALTGEPQSVMGVQVIPDAGGKLLDFARKFPSALTGNNMIASISSMSQYSIDTHSVYVVLDEGSEPMLANPSSSQFAAIKSLVLKAKNILWISMRADGANSASGADMNLATGFTRVARKENEGLRIVSLVVKQDLPDKTEILHLIARILKITFQEQRCPDYEGEYEYRNGSLLVPRLRIAKHYDRKARGKTDQVDTEMTRFLDPQRPLMLAVEVPGLLSSIRFTDEAIRGPLGPHEVEVLPRAYGVNATNMSTVDETRKVLPISEWAGIVTAVGSAMQDQWRVGDRVCGLGGTQPFASNPRIRRTELVRHIPPSMAFVDAASSLHAFATAYYALMEIAKLERHQSILIQTADEPTGQAAVAIAQLVGAKIYATVKDSAGMRLLTEKFGFSENQIYSSKSTSFRQGILRQTMGRGVDVILNSLTASTMEDSWACMATFGTFIDLVPANSERWMTKADNNATVTFLDLGVLVRDRPWVVGAVVEEILTMFEDGRLKPLFPVRRMTIAEIEDAFLLIAKGQTTKKVILDIHDAAVVKTRALQTPETRFSADATYVVAGGLGDTGQKICRLLASLGARHIVALSRSGKTRHAGDREVLEEQLKALGARLYVLACDITEETRVHNVTRWCAANLPPVRGLIQSATVFQDRMLEGMDVELFNDTVRPKRTGTLNLHKYFATEYLDFFVMISSAATVLGIKGQAHYNSGNSFEEGFAMQNAIAGSRAHFTAIMPALISGSDADATGPQRKTMLYRQGATTVEFDEVLALVEYAVGAQAPMDGYTQLICGIAPEMIPDDGTYNLRYFFDVLQSRGDKITTEAGQAQGAASLSRKLAAAKGPKELSAIISDAITEKISALIAIGLDELTANVPLAQLGIDSLVAIEVKNWIGREFEVPLQTAQVIDAPSIAALAETIMNGSTKLNQENGDNNEKLTAVEDADKHAGATKASLEVAVGKQQRPDTLAKHGFECCRTSKQLPTLPLLDLDSVLDLYLGAVKHLLEPEQLARMTQLLTSFREPDGLGRRLFARLQERSMDPAIDNWQFQPYLETIFTSRNYPVSPFNTFAGSDPLSDFQHGQAERATVISLAVLKFKQQLEAGKLEPAVIGGRPQCMYLHSWLFNSFREPLVGLDQMRKLPSKDYVAVLRRGHLFRVDLTDSDGSTIPFRKLQATFQSIVDRVDDDSWIGLLTADERDSWAEIRQMASGLSPENQKYFDMIEGAAFVLCLDEGSPTNPQERMERMLLNDGFNRWFDKGLKFVVCSNGVSGSVIEHTMIDGLTVRELYDATASAILDHPGHGYEKAGPDVDDIQLDEYSFRSSPAIDARIDHVRARYRKETSIIGFTIWAWDRFGQEFLQARKLSPKGIFEAMVQLATRYFLGKSHPCWSAISMGHYHKGRPEIIQTYTAEMQTFCDAVDRDGVAARALLADAARSHASNITRTQQGRGYERTISAMQTMLWPGEEMPELYNDPVYVSMRPHWVMTGSTDIGAQGNGEFGMVLRYPDSVWVQYVVDADGARFSIVTGKDRVDRFCECLERAGRVIHELLKDA